MKHATKMTNKMILLF